MHTVTVCPRCNEEFMYHSTEVNLIRLVVVVDEFTNIDKKDIIICQDCDFKEKWIHKEVKVKKGNAYEHLNQYKLFVVDIENNKLDFPITVQVGESDSFEWFNEDELEICKDN
jgi:hypothetical protein